MGDKCRTTASDEHSTTRNTHANATKKKKESKHAGTIENKREAQQTNMRAEGTKEKRKTENEKKGKDKVVCLTMAHASCELAEQGALL